MLMNNYQKTQFLQLVTKLFQENTYYKELAKGIKYKEMDSDEIYRRLPYQNRKSLQSLGDKVYTSLSESVTVEITSGTTGEPLECPKRTEERISLALDLWDKRRRIDPLLKKDDFFLLYGSKAREHHNFFNYDLENLKKCMQFLAEVNPRWICGSISAFERYSNEIISGRLLNGMTNLRYIELQGEYVDNDVRKLVEQAFQAKTIVHYGNREMWTMAYECLDGKLHTNDRMAYFEIRKENLADKYGHIIVTSLNQVTLPIIKYDTGDIGRIIEYECSCGQKRVLEIVDGRVSTIIKGTKLNGNIVMKGILNDVIKKNQKLISRFYVEQIEINTFLVYIDKGPDYGVYIESEIEAAFKRRINKNVNIVFKYTTNIPGHGENKSPIFRVCCE